MAGMAVTSLGAWVGLRVEVQDALIRGGITDVATCHDLVGGEQPGRPALAAVLNCEPSDAVALHSMCEESLVPAARVMQVRSRCSAAEPCVHQSTLEHQARGGPIPSNWRRAESYTDLM